MTEAQERLLANSIPTGGIFGCLVWQGKPRNGYGRISVGGFVYSVHRLAYEEWVGDIPDSYHIHHRCGNKLCIASDHLEAVSPREHVLGRHPEIIQPAHEAAVAATAAKNRAKTHCVNGHELTPENTWVRKEGWRQCRVCLRERQRARRARLAHV